MRLDQLLEEAERLPAAEKWRLVKHLLRSLEEQQSAAPHLDGYEFLRATYASLKDTPIERPHQLTLEERESLE